jgi:hypothetical protein
MRRLILALPLLAACETPVGPRLPTNAEPFTPPAVYREWWALTEACSGLQADFTRIAWFHVPGAESIPLADGTLVNGRWDRVSNRIVLAGQSERFGDLVRHEMLHALLRSGGHPRDAFIGRCGGTVVCEALCIQDAGPPPPPDPAATMVDLSALQIAVELVPAQPSVSVNDGWFRMVVTARNPMAGPVLVQLPSSNAGPGPSFSYDITERQGSSGYRYDMRADAPEVSRFAPFETKQFIFDLQIGAGQTRYDIPPGRYWFKGAYGGVWAPAPSTVTLSP